MISKCYLKKEKRERESSYLRLNFRAINSLGNKSEIAEINVNDYLSFLDEGISVLVLFSVTVSNVIGDCDCDLKYVTEENTLNSLC